MAIEWGGPPDLAQTKTAIAFRHPKKATTDGLASSPGCTWTAGAVARTRPAQGIGEIAFTPDELCALKQPLEPKDDIFLT